EPEPSVPLWDGEPPEVAEPEPASPPMAASGEVSQDVLLDAAHASESGASTVAGGFLAPSADVAGEDTKDIDVDVDVLAPEDDLDVAVESVRSIAPNSRSAPPPPPRAALNTL